MALVTSERAWIGYASKKAFMRDMHIMLCCHQSPEELTKMSSVPEWLQAYLENIDEVKRLALVRCIKEGWEIPT